MKTLREILWNRHRSVEPKLDRMWVKTLAPSLRGEETPAGANPLIAFGWTLWRELVWPSRKIWAGLACAWVVILTLNMVSSEPTTRVASKVEPRSRDEMQALTEQRRMLAQLLDLQAETSRTRKSRPPGPRSDRAAGISAV